MEALQKPTNEHGKKDTFTISNLRQRFRYYPLASAMLIPLRHNGKIDEKMTFEIPPSSFCELYTCCHQILNGNFINSSYTNGTNSECMCPFEGNSDIAGPGVLTAFIVTAWITCTVAATASYCGICKKFSDHLSSHGSQFRSENFNHVIRNTVVYKAAQWTSSDFLVQHCYKGIASVLHRFEKQRPKTKKAAQASLDILCDIQLVTGTAIMIAGIAQMDSLTFYHQELVSSYWLLTLNSFWAARSGEMQSAEGDHDNDNGWHYWTRQIFILLTSVLAIYYQLTIYPLQHKQWDPLGNGLCYIYHDKSDYQQNFFWIAGLIIFALYILLVLLADATARLKGSKNWMDIASEWFNHHQKKYHKKYENWISHKLQLPKGVEQTELQAMPHNTSTSGSAHVQPPASDAPEPQPHVYGKCAAKVVLSIPLGVEWAVLRFFVLWAWGDDNSVFVIFALFLFAAWNTFDVIDLKVSNADLATDESGWGFGQILPMVLLGLILLQIMDAIQDARKEDKKDSDSGFDHAFTW